MYRRITKSQYPRTLNRDEFVIPLMDNPTTTEERPIIRATRRGQANPPTDLPSRETVTGTKSPTQSGNLVTKLLRDEAH